MTGQGWTDFSFPDMFNEIQRGKRLKKADHTSGNVPYVASTALNNGVDGFIEEAAGTRAFEDCLSIANSGSVGTVFYEPFRYVASDHVTSLKREGASRQLYLFIATSASKQAVNFNFNREINDARIRKLRLMLPVNEDGQPDCESMEASVKERERDVCLKSTWPMPASASRSVSSS